MRRKGLLCKVSCRFSCNSFKTRFRKGRLYPVVLREDSFWWLINLEEKKRIRMVVSSEIMKKYFKLYQPVKKKSKYERWKVG